MVADKFLNCVKNMPEESFSDFLTALFKDKETRIAMASNPDIPVVILEILTEYLAGNFKEDFPFVFVTNCKEDKNGRLFEAIAKNSTTPDYLLDKLADILVTISNEGLISVVSCSVSMIENFNTNADTLDKLADIALANIQKGYSTYIDVVISISKNPKTRADTLDKFMNCALDNCHEHTKYELYDASNEFSKYIEILQTIVTHPNIHTDSLNKLANTLLATHKLEKALFAISYKRLAIDTKMRVEYAADFNRRYDQFFGYIKIFQELVANHKTPACTLTMLATALLPIYKELAAKPDALEDSLTQEQLDGYKKILQAIADNSNTPPETKLLLILFFK